MPTNITGIDLIDMGQKAITANSTLLAPFKAFSVGFDTVDREGDTVRVQIIENPTASDWNDTTRNYVTGHTGGASNLDVPLEKRILSSFTLTGKEMERTDVQALYNGAVKAVSKQAMAYIVGKIDATFAALTACPVAAFDTGDIIDGAAVLDDLDCNGNYTAVICNKYAAQFRKDNRLAWINGQSSVTGPDGGMDIQIVKTGIIKPANAGDLAGWITDKEGLAVATGKVVPALNAAGYFEHTEIADPVSGMTFGVIKSGNNANGAISITIEALLGCRVNKQNNLRRFVI